MADQSSSTGAVAKPHEPHSNANGHSNEKKRRRRRPKTKSGLKSAPDQEAAVPIQQSSQQPNAKPKSAKAKPKGTGPNSRPDAKDSVKSKQQKQKRGRHKPNPAGSASHDLHPDQPTAKPRLPLEPSSQQLDRALKTPLQRLVEDLKANPRITDLEDVLTARVPIIKLVDSATGFPCDINCSNLLGLRNTELLAAYGVWDNRFLQLGFFLKKWAKLCGINDASQGYMSSYALIMLLLHYLQRTTPPVLPYLQQLETKDQPKQPVLLNDCNVYFCEDLAEHRQHWPDNDSSIGTLLIGFFDYYACSFDWFNDVVCVSTPFPLHKLDVEWTRSAMAVQDPFDLHHNLTRGVKPPAFTYILDRFETARRHYRHVAHQHMALQPSMATMMDADVLRNHTQPPVEIMLCHMCQKPGHFARDCPRLKVESKT